MENKERVACCLAQNSNDFSRASHTRIFVCPTTGGKLELKVSGNETVQGLKYFISRKLRIQHERIKLLHRNRLLNHGTLRENNVTDNSKITLIPHLESGLTFQRDNSNVLKALESLTDSQVNDFLSGKAPLVLGMRVADHIVFIQLQLSTYQSRRHHRPAPVKVPSNSPVKDHQEVPSPTTTPDHNSFTNYRQYEHCVKNTDLSSNHPSSPSQHNSGAVIHRMQHLGQGIYSGTFSGVLDPSVQERDGQPRRNISTIANILNDLLGASPSIDIARAGSLRDQLNKTTSKTQDTVQQENVKDDPVLREKVEQLQRMMGDRKKRRQNRRQTIAPYIIESRHQENKESICEKADIITTKESETLAV
ncbi:Midnolin-A,Midnolin [Mytilus coruscus]|uniref:Midnolin-A,Midnolin n=1 Tax=Mytilus coruscus TaxID=42192 RepID=A0A6J8AQX3_MYTCO|nr:Midnolin-A,Midnolin [Mytilus coruscus]